MMELKIREPLKVAKKEITAVAYMASSEVIPGATSNLEAANGKLRAFRIEPLPDSLRAEIMIPYAKNEQIAQLIMPAPAPYSPQSTPEFLQAQIEIPAYVAIKGMSVRDLVALGEAPFTRDIWHILIASNKRMIDRARIGASIVDLAKTQFACFHNLNLESVLLIIHFKIQSPFTGIYG